MLSKPRLQFDQLPRNLIRYPAITLTQQSDKVRPAALNFSQTNGQNFAALGLLFGGPPAQIYLAPGNAALFTQLAQLRKDALDQLIALPLHIAKGRGHEHPNDTLVRRCSSTSVAHRLVPLLLSWHSQEG